MLNSKIEKWREILADTDELPENEAKTVEVDGENFCVTHYEGKFGVLDNTCSHEGGPLGEDKKPINKQILDYVAEPVEMIGEVTRKGDYLYFYSNPDSIRRLP